MSVIDISTRAVIDPVPEATFGFAEQDRPEAGSIRIDQTAPHRWCAVDRRLPPGDPFRTLARIAYRDGWYEVAQLGERVEWSVFASLDAAIAHLVVTSTALAQQRLVGPDEWAPLPARLADERPHLVAVPRR